MDINFFKKFYADNTVLNLGSGGDTINTEENSGVKTEVVKVAFGTAGTVTKVSAANPLPVTDNAAEVSLASIDLKINDGTQKTQIVDGAGNVIGSTGNGLDVNIKSGNVTLVAEDIEIGAVELKDSTTNDRASIINTAPTTEFGLVTRNIPSGVQAVSGTVTVVGGGDATAANQVTGNASLAAIDAGIPAALGQTTMANSMPVTIASNQSAIPISAASMPLPTNAAQETGGNLASILTELNTINLGIPAALGQTTMAASMPVTLASNQSAIPVTFSGSPAVDNTQIYSGTLSVTGAITGIDTTGYSSVIAQITGIWTGNFWFEGSNDNSNWQELTVISLDNVYIQDIITFNSVFVIKTTAKFIRINVIQLQSGSITALLLGRTVPSINAIDVLSYAMDKSNNTPLYISEIDSNKDINKSLIPSDAPKPIYGLIPIANGSVTIDTTGYQSISVQVYNTGGLYTFSSSNDGSVFTTAIMYSANDSGIPTSSASTLGLYKSAIVGRFFRITSNTAGASFVAYLRQIPVGSEYQNISAIGGNAVLSGGLNGTLAVGGNSAQGGTLQYNPLVIGGVDSGNLVRRLITDTTGRLIPSVTDQSGTARPLGGVAPAASNQNVASLTVQDTSQFEGQSFMELLGQILLELRISNQYKSEEPFILQQIFSALNNSNNTAVYGFKNEPQEFRNEQSIFNN